MSSNKRKQSLTYAGTLTNAFNCMKEDYKLSAILNVNSLSREPVDFESEWHLKKMGSRLTPYIFLERYEYSKRT